MTPLTIPVTKIVGTRDGFLDVWGTGSASREFFYVDDAAHRARERFGFVAGTSFKEGLRRTIEWYEAARRTAR